MWVYTTPDEAGRRSLLELERGSQVWLLPPSQAGFSAVLQYRTGESSGKTAILARYPTLESGVAALEALAARVGALDVAALAPELEAAAVPEAA